MSVKRKQVQQYQYEPLVTPSKWTGDEHRFAVRLTQILDDLHAKFNAIRSKLGIAEKLETPRTIRTKLDSTEAASFDGTKSVTPGVTGILPIENGGTGASTRKNAFANLAYLGLNPIASVADDTVANWLALGPGYARYATSGLLTDQPSKYGFLLNVVESPDAFQIWKPMSTGPLYCRAGNSSGWAVSWKKLFDETSVIPIANGGTGATEAAKACENLGAVKKSGDTMTGDLAILKATPQLLLRNEEGVLGVIQGLKNSANTNISLRFAAKGKGTSFYEYFALPYANNDLTANAYYSLLTSKAPVTIGQGGTGAATAAGARTNLKVNLQTYSEPTQFGASYASAPREFHAALPSGSVFIGIAGSFTDAGWNFPNKTATLEVLKYNGVRSRYLLHLKSGASYWSEIEDTIGYPTCIWHRFYDDKSLIPVENGGTGATTAAAARTNLGLNRVTLWSGTAANGASITFTESLDNFSQLAVKFGSVPSDVIAWTGGTVAMFMRMGYNDENVPLIFSARIEIADDGLSATVVNPWYMAHKASGSHGATMASSITAVYGWR